jgi:hypothetical protein
LEKPTPGQAETTTPPKYLKPRLTEAPIKNPQLATKNHSKPLAPPPESRLHQLTPTAPCADDLDLMSPATIASHPRHKHLKIDNPKSPPVSIFTIPLEKMGAQRKEKKMEDRERNRENEKKKKTKQNKTNLKRAG